MFISYVGQHIYYTRAAAAAAIRRDHNIIFLSADLSLHVQRFFTMSETTWFPQYYNEENQERYASASSSSPRSLFDQWAYSCVGRRWEVRIPLQSSTIQEYYWCEAFIASYEPLDYAALDTQETQTTPSFLRRIARAALRNTGNRAEKFGVQKFDDDGNLLPEQIFLHLAPEQVRPSVAAWKNRTREIISSIFSLSEEEIFNNDFETPSIQDEIFNSVTFKVSLSVPLTGEQLGLKFCVNSNSNIELVKIFPNSIAFHTTALHIGDILVKCSSVDSFLENAPKPFMVVENDCTNCRSVTVIDAYVKSHKDFGYMSSGRVEMTFRRTLTHLVSFHTVMGNEKSDTDGTSDITESVLQKVCEALKKLLQLKDRFDNQVTNDSELDDLSAQMSTIAKCCDWYLQGAQIKSKLTINSMDEGGRTEKSFLKFEELCLCVELGNKLVPELNKIGTLHERPDATPLSKDLESDKSSSSLSPQSVWFVNIFIELHLLLSRELQKLQIWLVKVQNMVDTCSNKTNINYFEVNEMIEALKQATIDDSINYYSLITKCDATNRLVDPLAKKVSLCKSYVEKLQLAKEQFMMIPPTPWDKALISSGINSVSNANNKANTTVDTTLLSLERLQAEILSKPELLNVKDFLKLPHLVEARKWAMKSVYAHGDNGKQILLRERLSFYQDLIHTASENQDSWARFGILPLISDQWRKIPELKCKVGFTVPLGQDPGNQKKQATINEVQEYLSKKMPKTFGLVTGSMIEDSLALLSCFPFLCILEEKMLLWLDVVHLTEQVKAGKKGAKISFNELSQLLQDSFLLCEGKSRRRNSKTKDLIPNDDVDQEVCIFSRDFAYSVSRFQEVAKQWLADAEQWRASAKQFLLGSPNSTMERARISQLLKNYADLNVNIKEEYDTLLLQARTFNKSNSIQSINNSEERSERKEEVKATEVGVSDEHNSIMFDHIEDHHSSYNSSGDCHNDIEDRSLRTENSATINTKISEIKTYCFPSESTDDDDDDDLLSIAGDDEMGERDFSTESFAMENRYNILKCLSKRKSLSLSHDSSPSRKKKKTCRLYSLLSTNMEQSYRTKMRCQLAKCFVYGVQELGLQETSSFCQEYCSILAWRLEHVVHERFAWHPSDNKVTEKVRYAEMLRRLRSNLRQNRTLCASVLIGKMDLPSLVDLSPEELASKHSQNRRDQAAKQAEKHRVLDASDTEFGLVGLLHQRSSSILAAVTEEIRSAMEMRVLSDQPGLEVNRNVSSETTTEYEPGHAICSDVNDLDAGYSSPHKQGSFEAQPGQSYEYPMRSPISDSKVSKVPDLLMMEEPNEKVKHEVLDVQLPDFEMDSEGRSHDLDNQQYDDEQESIELEESDDDLRSSTPLDASYKDSTELSNLSSPTINPPTLGEGPYRIKPKGGGMQFQFILKEKVITSFKANLFVDKNPEFLAQLEELFPYALKELRSCSFDSFREFIRQKQIDSNFDIIFCRLSLSNTEIKNQDKYKEFRRTYEEKNRVPIIKLGPELTLYLIVPKLAKILLNVDNISGLVKDKIESTHLIFTRPKKVKNLPFV